MPVALTKRLWWILRDTWAGFSHDGGLRLAAALAFYATLSLGPMVILLLFIIGQFSDPTSAQAEIAREVEHLIGGPAAEAMVKIINQANEPIRMDYAALLSLAVLFFSATAAFAQLQEAMNHIFNVPRKKRLPLFTIARQRLISVLMLLSLAALTFCLVIASSVLEFVNRTVGDLHPMLKIVTPILDWGFSLMVFVGLFAAVFKLLPEQSPPWRDVRVGALMTGLLFAVGRELISFTLGRARPSSAYGAAGSIIIILLWVYYSSAILFFGAEFTQAVGRARVKIEARPA